MFEWIADPAPALCQKSMERASARQGQLTKPPGSLGRLEELALLLASMQGSERPTVDSVSLVVFAADHGVAEEKVSAFPQEVTAEMVKNFSRGGAAISVLARQLGATLEVVNMGTTQDPGPLPGVVASRISPGSANFCKGPAMSVEQLAEALHAGRSATHRAVNAGAQLFIGGEMGIANTTSATALASALLRKSPAALAGPGTGLNSEGIMHKVSVIEKALSLHSGQLGQGIDVLRCLGGLEIAALCGAFISAAQHRLPLLVDGFIATAAALVAERINPSVRRWMIFAHTSAEPGHQAMLDALQAQPLLNMGLRLGEGSGAATAVPLLRMACALHNEMATFAEAGVSEAE
jgi:nicotinate-nucleotide--dimethylbenzimidazole phosphoribosyltransferase